jgi:hypothetical protein
LTPCLDRKESSSCLRGIDALIGYGEEIGHRFGLLHGDLLHRLEICDAVAEGVDVIDVLDVRDGIPGVAETLDEVAETFIRLLLDGFQRLHSGWPLVCPLEVSNEQSAELVP